MAAQQFCLKWNNHTNNMLEIFNTLLSTEALVDVTLACDGLSLKAHKIVLSACSPFFQSLFLENPCQHPIVIMKDIPYKDLKAIVDFMYRGEVNVSQDQLSGLLRTAETLKVKGLADENRGVQQEVSTSQNSVVPPSTSTSTSQQRRADSPPLHAKRKKGRPRKRSLSDSNRSDDEMGPAKIKEPNSPEIEELSEDAILDEGRSDSMIRQRSSSSQRRIRSSVNTSFSSKSLTPSNAHIEEPPSGEEEFELEPSKLLEQTLTTDAASSVSNTALTSTMPVNFNLPSSSGIEISQIGSDSQALVPVAGTSDSSHLQGPDSPPDIKPTITTFDESQSDSMMYMDQSSLPGPSNYQDNSMMQGDEQPQGYSSDIEQLKNNQKTMWEVPSEFVNAAKQIERKLNSLMASLQAQQHKFTQEQDSQSNEEMNLISSLPVGMDGFNRLNEKIAQNSSFRETLIKIVSTAGGRDCKALAANALRKLMLDDVGEKFSLTGRLSKLGPVKQSFEKTEVYKLVLDICYRTFSGARENVIREAISDWLMQAKFRKSRRIMASFRADIISSSSSVDVREVDKQAKNPWRWEWLEKEAEGIYLREIILKLNKCGACYCIICSKELAYGSRGFVALTDHMKSAKHKSSLQTHKEHFTLPERKE